MNDFKVGDRVEVVAARMTMGCYNNGDVFTIARVAPDGDLDMVEMTGQFLHPDEVRLITPAPDVLTIPRAELPEVVEVHGFLRADEFDYGLIFSATQHRRRALAQLAVSEFLAAREKAEQDAADQHTAILNKRRDELAREFSTMEAIIDYAIQLEGQVKK